MKKEIKCVELFAGVGGFRVGIEKHNTNKFKFNTIWSNQWEPSTNVQHASDIYKLRFGDIGHFNEDINKIDAKKIPEHDLLCGGFPCQEYSIGTVNAKGIVGKKGVLWWDIHRIIKEKKTPYLILENVDRIIISPSKQRGKDFSIILKSLIELDYIVEWRIINAAEYGMPQKRKRTYFLVYKKNSKLGKEILKKKTSLIENMYLNEEFKIKKLNVNEIIETDLSNSIKDISDNFNKNNDMKIRAYYNCGIAFDNKAYSLKVENDYIGNFKTIEDILIDEKDIPLELYINNKDISKWENYKFAKSVPRVNKTTGFKYNYVQGNMDFPDKINKPSRTIITSEGGKTASRTTHAIEVNGKLRRLHPIEIERLNGFPDNHTIEVGFTKRGFLMGNALMVDIITKISNIIKNV